MVGAKTAGNKEKFSINIIFHHKVIMANQHRHYKFWWR